MPPPALFLYTLCFSEFLGIENLPKHLCSQAHGYSSAPLGLQK